MAPLPLTSRPMSLVAVAFFLSHIPVTLFVDSQAVLPASWYPAWAKRAMAWYLDMYGDPLMATLPPWFKALVWSEVLVQLPFFFWAAAAFARGDARIVRPAAAYGIAVATTLIPILAELAASPDVRDEAARATLLAFYTPYLVVPLAIGVWALRAAGTDPFKGGGRGGGRSKRA